MPDAAIPIRIFIAEDNPADVYLLKEAFREHGMAVDLQILYDGEEALHFLDRLDGNEDLPCPDIALIDLNLPKISGESLIRRLRNSPKCEKSQILVLTSSDSPDERSRAMACGANVYLQKPSVLDEFMKIGGMVRDLHSGMTH
jgi:two-component system, chemotaxis family, response regulator Rcp1